MILFSYFRMTFGAVFQIALIGLCGYILVKKKVINEEALKLISNGVINLFFPCFIFVSIVRNFDFRSYPNWWVFPFISFFITIVGFLIGIIFVRIRPELKKAKQEFVSLVAFQNSGYLPLILVSLMFLPGQREYLVVSIFLFLLGFNFIFWSFSHYYLSGKKERKISLRLLFNPPVAITLVSLFIVAVNLAKFIPPLLMVPAEMLGNCALTLAIIVVGGNLALSAVKANKQFAAIAYLTTAKLLVVPIILLAFIFLLRPPEEIAFLILLQGAMPAAVSLGVVTRKYDISDELISLGTFWTHVLGLITIPIWLAIFGALSVYFK